MGSVHWSREEKPGELLRTRGVAPKGHRVRKRTHVKNIRQIEKKKSAQGKGKKVKIEKWSRVRGQKETRKKQRKEKNQRSLWGKGTRKKITKSQGGGNKKAGGPPK